MRRFKSPRKHVQFYPCTCGFTCATQARMRSHRRACREWYFRRDPVGLALARMKQTRKDRAEALGLRHSKCAECNRWRGRHAATCSHHISEIVRRQMIDKYEIDPEAFKVLLGLLAKRYTAVPFIPPASEARSV